MSETDAREASATDVYAPVRLQTDRGRVDCRYYAVERAAAAVILVGGVGGGWDSPARGLYPRLAETFAASGVAALRVRYRYPTVLDEAVYDVLAGARYLQDLGIQALGLVGHSFGGAVVIRAAARAKAVRTVVALATQAFGAEPAAALAPRCSLLLVHGTDDRVLRPVNAELVHELAGEPKRLPVLPSPGHRLDESADEVFAVVREWLVAELLER